MHYIKNVLTQNAFWQINKRLVQELGIEGAVFLTDVIEKFYHYKANNQTIFRPYKKNGENYHWFYFTQESIEKTFQIGYKVQKRIIAELAARSLIMTKLFGSPAKQHITICERQIAMLLNTGYTGFAETLKLEFSQKGETIDNNISNNNSLDSNIKKGENKNFVVPKPEEVKNYFAEHRIYDQHERFFDFYESKGWHVGKNKMKDWKAAVRNWIRGHKKDDNSQGEQPQQIRLK